MTTRGLHLVEAGRNERVIDDRLGRLPLGPWSPGPKAIWLCIQPKTLTGRRIPPPHGQQPEPAN